MRPPANGSARALSDAPGNDPALVTVIEDEAIVLVGYQMLFESWGYNVVAAGSAEEALNLLRSKGRPPDIIIADYRLKDGQTGVGAIRSIQGEFGEAIPGILVTGDTGAERLREAAASGLPILHKPVNGGQLRDLLVRCLASA
jgi:CheY-like chemotaxis protein